MQGIKESKIDSVLQSRQIAISPFNRFIIRQLIRIGSGGQKEFLHLLTRSVSYMMFILMPFVGLILFILYRKQTEHFISSLIFSVHYHTFAFLLLTVLLLIARILSLDLIILSAPVILALYLYISLRAVYRQSRLLTLLKTILTGLFHMIGLIILFLLTIFLSLLIF